MEVKWKVQGIFKADAQKCYEEIGADKVTPEEVLAKATDENSELHKCFEWDDTEAANKYRLIQARQIIQMIVIKQEDTKKPEMRVFQITTERNTYQPTILFLEQKDEYQALLDRALRELEAFKVRYSTLSELENIFKEIELVLK